MKPQDLRNLVNSKEFKEEYKKRKPIMIMVEKIYNELWETEAVLIWDILHYNDGIDRDYMVFWLDEVETNLLVLWNQWKDKPIEEQSDECIEFVYKITTENKQLEKVVGR